MKNSETVYRIIVGELSPAKDVNVCSSILARLVGTEDDAAADNVLPEILFDLGGARAQGLPESPMAQEDFASVFKALMIALPISCAIMPERVSKNLHQVPAEIAAGRDTGNYANGFLVGWIEGAVWLYEHDQLCGKTENIFPVSLARVFCEAINTGQQFTPLNAVLEGRLANVSKKFVTHFDCMAMLEKLQAHPSVDRVFMDDHMKGGAQAIMTELCKKMSLDMNTRDTITTLVNSKKKDASQFVHRKVLWRQLSPNDVLGPGDMYASIDPNTPEFQGISNYNLQMQAVDPEFYGKPPGTNLGNGWHWRPREVIGIEPK